MKLPRGGIEGVERRGVALRARRIAVVADGFEGEHGDDAIAPGLALASVDPRAHVGGPEGRWLLVHEQDEADGALAGLARELCGEREHRRDTRGVVVGTGRAVEGVVVGPHHDDLVGVGHARELNNQVGRLRARGDRDFLDALVPGLAQAGNDVLGGAAHAPVLHRAARADGRGERLDIGAKPSRERGLWLGERWERAAPAPPGHHDHGPVGPEPEHEHHAEQDSEAARGPTGDDLEAGLGRDGRRG